jgi:hypothetical protein
MKKKLFLFLLVIAGKLHAQDTTKIVYTAEQDTLIKQRFIDRYENVFMTKVPTRHMLKVGLEFVPFGFSDFGNPYQQTQSILVGYEYKLLPAVSLGVNARVRGGWNGGTLEGTLTANVYGRWYFDMNRRIAEGKSANNFSGNYLAIVGEKNWQSYQNQYPQIKTGVEFGLQRRFFNNGVIDFAVGAYYQRYEYDSQRDWRITFLEKNDFEISTRTTFGFAFGDWKKADHIPACDVFRCDESINNQWKILWPVVKISTNVATGTLGIGYEQKLGNSPVSINTQLLADYKRIKFKSDSDNLSINGSGYQVQLFVQSRYYFLQKRNIRRGKGGNNLSGFYVGSHMDFVHYQASGIQTHAEMSHLGAGFTYGYQRTLFRNAYIDISGTQSWNLLRNQPGNNRLGTFRIGFGLTF